MLHSPFSALGTNHIPHRIRDLAPHQVVKVRGARGQWIHATPSTTCNATHRRRVLGVFPSPSPPPPLPLPLDAPGAVTPALSLTAGASGAASGAGLDLVPGPQSRRPISTCHSCDAMRNPSIRLDSAKKRKFPLVQMTVHTSGTPS